MIPEKRKYIRIDISMDFSYKIRGTGGPAKRAVTKNISPSGISALVDSSIKKGDWLEVGLYIPRQRKPISSICKVIWTADEKAGKIDAGIKFEEISPEKKNVFLEYLCELMFAELDKFKK